LSEEAEFTTAGLSLGTHTISFTVIDDDGGPSEPVIQTLTVEEIPDEIEMDNGGSGTSYTGTWSVSSGSDPYGTDSLYSRDGATYTWTFTPPGSSLYQVFMWWTVTSSRSDSVPVTIEHSGGTDTIYINQLENGGQWNSLGQYFFESGLTYSITITAQPSPSSTCADAVKFVKINTEVPPVADFSANKTAGGAPCIVHFYDQSMGIVTEWFWNFGDEETSTEKNPSHEYADPGRYTVSLTVTNAYGSDTETKEYYIEVYSATENIYVCHSYSGGGFMDSLVHDMVERIGGYENNGVWVYENPAKEVTYLIHDVWSVEAMEAALKEEGAHVLWYGHSNYGSGGVFATETEQLQQVKYNIYFADDDLMIHFSTDMADVSIDGLKYGQAYPNWEPIYKNGESAIAPYDFGDPRGVPPYNYYVTYTIPGDPTHYRVELSNGRFIERFPWTVPAWYSPDGSPPDPVENPEYFITNPAPEFNHCDLVGTWPVSTQDNDNPEYRGHNYQYHSAGSGANTATYTLVVEYPGNYIVSASWQPDGSNASNAKYTIQHAAGESTVEVDQREGGRCAEVTVEIYDGESLLDTVIVNQQTNAGDWNVLGTYLFSGTARLVITSQGTCTTSADAARFVISPDEYFVDNGDAGTSATGTWRVSSAPRPYNESSLYSTQAGAAYSFEAAADGLCEVSLWWTQRSSRYKYLGEFYFDEGVNTIQLTDNANGRVIADYMRLSFNDAPQNPQAEFRADVVSGTAPLIVQFDDLSYASGGVTEYYWDFGDGETSNEPDPAHEYSAPGLYAVSLTITDELGNKDTEVKEAFIVVDSDAPLHAEFTSTNRRSSRGISFIDQSSGNIDEWLWDFGDGETSDEQNPRHTYEKGGEYTVTLTVTGPDGTDTEIEENFVYRSPSSPSADSTTHYKEHYRGKVILDKSSFNLDPEELKYSRMFLLGCLTAKYFVGTFQRGKMFFTNANWREMNTVSGYLERYLLGESDEEILEWVNSREDIYEFYDFGLLPPSMR
jgi:PKD repeat protein